MNTLLRQLKEESQQRDQEREKAKLAELRLTTALEKERLARQRAEDDAEMQGSLRRAAERRVAEASVSTDISAENIRHCTEQIEELSSAAQSLENRAQKAEMQASEMQNRWEKMRLELEGKMKELVVVRSKNVQASAQRSHALLHVEKLRSALAVSFLLRHNCDVV